MSDSLEVYHTQDPHPDTHFPDMHQDTFSKTILGFWMYLMSDCVLFASLFATFAVLRSNAFGGPTSQQLFSLSTTFAETMILLFSSVTCGLSVLSALKKNQKNHVILWLVITFLLGASFLALELHEFINLVREGNSWQRSAFLSSFFTLVGTHGLHISVGLLWVMVLIGQIGMTGVTIFTFRRLVVFSMFWHFLDLIWIFIFTFVYLIGVI
jgi:cytochrome o ubiquinol oxidase subunit 3